MDVSTALSQLGLTSLPSATDLKRTYLKAVRQHPPERDPEGFVRVRAAYELLLEVAQKSLPEEHAMRPRVPLATSKSVEGTTSNSQSPAAASPLESALPGENASADELMTRGSELLLSNTAAIESIQWLIERLESTASSSAVVDMLKHAVGSGSQRALWLLLEGSPADVDEHMLERARHSMDERTRIALVRHYWQRGDAPEAAELLTSIYESSTVEQEARPHPVFCLDVVLRCNEMGRHAAATALLNAFDDWQALRADSKDLLGHVAARWQLARELRSLRRCLSPRLRQSLASAVVNDDSEALTVDLAKHENRMSRRKLELFAHYAPALYAFARPHLPQLLLPLERIHPYRKPPTWFSVTFALGVAAVLNLLGHCMSAPSSWSSQAKSRQELAQGAKAEFGANRNAPQEFADPPNVTVDPAGLAEAAQRLGYFALAARTTAVWNKIQSGECRASPRELDEFLRSAQLSSQATPELGRPLEAFLGYVGSACDSKPRSSTR